MKWNKLTNTKKKFEENPLACVGLKECEIDFKLDRSCANRVINFVVDILRDSNYTWGDRATPIGLKIGINNGPVITIVIGFHKPKFSLIEIQ